MQIASLSEIKKELKEKTNHELTELVLKLTKHKVENKELLAYVLFESADENHFISKIESESNKASCLATISACTMPSSISLLPTLGDLLALT